MFQRLLVQCIIISYLPFVLPIVLLRMVWAQLADHNVIKNTAKSVQDFIQNSLPVYSNLFRTLSSLNALYYVIAPSNKRAAYEWNTDICEQSNFKYPSRDKIAQMMVKNSGKVLADLQYPLQHAIAIYPPVYLVFLGITPSLCYIYKSTKDLIQETFALNDDDLIAYDKFIDQRHTWLNFFLCRRGRNDVYHPSYYLIRDEREKAYVLAIRGSSTVTDWTTDAALDSIDFIEGDVSGKAHDGMYKSAKNVYDSVINELRSMPNGYKLIVTGHSLGAGVASIIGLLLLFREGNEKIVPKLTVYSFATPSIVSRNICDDNPNVQQYIKSVILNTDVVSRIGTESLRQYNRRIDVLRQYHADHEDHSKHFAKYFMKRSIRKECPYPEQCLFPAGQIYWCLPKNLREGKGGKGGIGVKAFFALFDTQRYQKEEWILCDSTANREIYGELALDGYESIYAHFPNRYAWAIGLSRQKLSSDDAHIRES